MADSGSVSHRDGGASGAARKKRLHKRKKKKSDPVDQLPKEKSVSAEDLQKDKKAASDASKAVEVLVSPKKKKFRQKLGSGRSLRASKSLENFDFPEKLGNVHTLSRSIEHLENLKRQVEENERKTAEEKLRLEKRRQKLEHQRRLLQQQEEIEREKLALKLAEKEELRQEIVSKVGEEGYRRMEQETQQKVKLAKLERQKRELDKLQDSIQQTQDGIRLNNPDDYVESLTEIGPTDWSEDQDLKNPDREPDLIKSVSQSIERNSLLEMEKEGFAQGDGRGFTNEGQSVESGLHVHFDQTSPHEGGISMETETREVDDEYKYSSLGDVTATCEPGLAMDYDDVEEGEMPVQFACSDEDSPANPEVSYDLHDCYDEELDSVAVGFAVATPQTPVGMSILEEIQLTEKIQQMDALWYQQATLESIGSQLDPFDGTLESYKNAVAPKPTGGPKLEAENGTAEGERATENGSAGQFDVGSEKYHHDEGDESVKVEAMEQTVPVASGVKEMPAASVTDQEVPVLAEAEGSVSDGATGQGEVPSGENVPMPDETKQATEEATDLLMDTEKLLMEAGILPDALQSTPMNGSQAAPSAQPLPTSFLEEAGVITDDTPASELLASPQIKKVLPIAADKQSMADEGVIFDRSVEVVSSPAPAPPQSDVVAATQPAVVDVPAAVVEASQLVDSCSSSASNKAVAAPLPTQTPTREAIIRTEAPSPAVIDHLVLTGEAEGDAIVGVAAEGRGDEKSPLLTPSQVEEIMQEINSMPTSDDNKRAIPDQNDTDVTFGPGNSESKPEASCTPQKTLPPGIDPETPSSEQAPLLGSGGKEDSCKNGNPGCCAGCSIL